MIPENSVSAYGLLGNYEGSRSPPDNLVKSVTALRGFFSNFSMTYSAAHDLSLQLTPILLMNQRHLIIVISNIKLKTRINIIFQVSVNGFNEFHKFSTYILKDSSCKPETAALETDQRMKKKKHETSVC
ncbi:uncharacterized protein LOC117181195 [Belonocnema kinseyi]|uniref:uncharacterized protein LOC117181195 n=1 Tax=Belonocnema kinseyi TaxID=2817044 RepID=UPI00143D043D|nr:uncharacterized protein LOC117181195 [Belonocnema kinseyi]